MTISELPAMFESLSERGLRFLDGIALPEAPPAGGEEDLFYRPHAHQHTEIICPVMGTPLLCVAGQWLRAPLLQVQVLVPGTLHSERYLCADAPYRMFWTLLFPEALMFHVTAYEPADGYSTPLRSVVFSTPAVTRLWRISQAPRFHAEPMLRARFHAGLMAVLQQAMDEPKRVAGRAVEAHQQIVEQIKAYVLRHYDEELSLSNLAELFRYSSGHMNALFRRVEGVPLHRFVNDVRLEKARQALAGGDLLVKQVALSVGFRDPLYFSRLFRRRYGVPPRALAPR